MLRKSPGLIIIVLLLLTSNASAQTGLMFSFNGTPDEIRIVSTSGVDGGALISPTVGGSPFGIGQSSNGQIFWVDIIDNTIYRANSDGTGTTSAISTLFGAETNSSPLSIFVDSLNSRVFWADSVNDAIRVANFDGTGGTTLYTGALAGTPNGIAYDPIENRVMWGDTSIDSIAQFDLDTMTASTLIDLDAFSPDAYNPRGLLTTDTHVYFADAGVDALFRANLDGSGVTSLLDVAAFYAANGNFGGASSNASISDIQLLDGVLYWTEGGSGKRGIYGYDINGGSAFRLLDTQSINSSASPIGLSLYSSAIPEPTSFGLCALAALTIGCRRRRRQPLTR